MNLTAAKTVPLHGRVGRGRQPPPDEGLQSRQPSQRGSKHHLSRRGRCSRPRHQWQSRCAAATSRRATGSRHRCRCCNGDNSGDVGSGDDGGSKSSSDGPAALHQHEQDRLGRARVGERSRLHSSESDASAASAAFTLFTEDFCFCMVFEAITPGFCTCLAHNVGRQRHWEVLCVFCVSLRWLG